MFKQHGGATLVWQEAALPMNVNKSTIVSLFYYSIAALFLVAAFLKGAFLIYMLFLLGGIREDFLPTDWRRVFLCTFITLVDIGVNIAFALSMMRWRKRNRVESNAAVSRPRSAG